MCSPLGEVDVEALPELAALPQAADRKSNAVSEPIDCMTLMPAMLACPCDGTVTIAQGASSFGRVVAEGTASSRARGIGLPDTSLNP